MTCPFAYRDRADLTDAVTKLQAEKLLFSREKRPKPKRLAKTGHPKPPRQWGGSDAYSCVSGPLRQPPIHHLWSLRSSQKSKRCIAQSPWELRCYSHWNAFG